MNDLLIYVIYCFVCSPPQQNILSMKAGVSVLFTDVSLMSMAWPTVSDQ